MKMKVSHIIFILSSLKLSYAQNHEIEKRKQERKGDSSLFYQKEIYERFSIEPLHVIGIW